MCSVSTSPAPMLARARQLAPKGMPVEFVLADATVYPFEAGSSDLLVSRFGVMFFAEPGRSFANMRKALRPTGRMAFACWREPRENPWLMLPLQAAYQHVPKLPQLGPEDPGPFAFASEQRVTRILGEAGFSGIAMERCDLVARCRDRPRARCGGRSRNGNRPGSRALEGQPADVKAAAAGSIREALVPFVRGQGSCCRRRSGS